VRNFMRGLLCPAFLIIFGFSVDAQENNLIQNPGFEENSASGKIPYWSIRCFSPYPNEISSGFPKFTADKEIKASGSQSLKISSEKKTDEVIIETSVPCTPGKTYKVSLMYKNNGPFLSCRENHIGKDGKHNRSRYKTILDVKDNNDWKKFEGKIAALPGDEKIGITFFAGRNAGELWLDDVCIAPLETVSGDEVKFRMTPNYYVDDNIYFLPQNDPMIVFLTVCNEAQYQAKNPRIIIELPEGIELLGSGYDSHQYAPPEKFGKNGKKYVRYDYTMGLPDVVLRNVDFNRTAYGSTVVMIKSSSSPSDKIMDGSIYFQDGDFKCKPCDFRIKVIPSVNKAHTPKLFRSGIFSETSVEFYGKALDEFASFYKQCGFNEIIIPELLRTGSRNPEGRKRNSEPIIRKMKEKGLRVQVSTNSLIDGYTIRYTPFTKQIPSSVRIKNAGGTVSEPNSFDPAYIYRKGEWYMKSANYVIDNILKMGADDIWTNWEPWMFVLEKGSFTEASLKDFSEFSGIPYDEIKSMKPMDITKKYEAQVLAFQSWQFVKVMRVLHDIFREKSKETGKNISFIAAVGPNTLDYYQKGKEFWKYTGAFGGEKYLKEFDVISSWYYLFMNYNSADNRKKALWKLGYRSGELADKVENLTNADTLKVVEEKVAFIKNVREKNGQKTIPYIHLTQNHQCSTWVVDPASIGHQMLASFIGGASGVGLYYFPRGYDGRYWASAANANDMIAFYEDYVFKGKKLSSGFSIFPETELFKHKNYANNLTLRAFEYNGKTLLALCNFDFIDNAFFSLNCENLPEGDYVLHDPYQKQYYCNEAGKGISSENLKRLLLEIPAESISFLVLEPYSDKTDYEKPVLLSEVKKKAERMIPELNKKFENRLSEIKKLLDDSGEKIQAFNDKDVTTIKENNFSAGIEDFNETKCYKISAPSQTLFINPSFGATVSSWNVNGKEMVFQKKNVGVLCKDRFYIPREYMSSQELSGVYRFVRHSVKGDFFEAEFEHKIISGPLPDFIINKKFIVDNKNNSFKVKYKISNGQNESRTIGLWVFNCPEVLSKENNSMPDISIENKKMKNFRSTEALLKLQGKSIAAGFENQIKGLLHPGIGLQQINSPDAELNGQNMKLSITPDKNSFYGYYTWSSVQSKLITFEIIFSPSIVKASDAWETEINYMANR